MQSTKLENEIKKIVEIALLEDCSLIDVTSDLTIKKKRDINFKIVARQDIVFCGEKVIREVFLQIKNSTKFKNSELLFKVLAKDGEAIKTGKSIVTGQGDAKIIFAAERVILNLIQHLSGIATITKKFVERLDNKKIKILDTRKTLPGLRESQKYAVRIGGGKNHRFNLSDMILIKDNHIAAAGGVAEALKLAKKNRKLKVEIECDTYNQVVEAISLEPDIIMLDNMTDVEIAKCSKKIRSYKKKKILIEISGGVDFDRMQNLGRLDVDFISIGSLTHSVKAVDIGLDII